MKRIISLSVFCSFIITISAAQMRNDVIVSMDDGENLEATFYYPTQSLPASGYPALLLVHGFGLSKDSLILDTETFAANGYVAMCYSVRGHGNSSGGSTIMSTRERLDLSQMIKYLRSLPNVDTLAIGVTGGSQGGLHGLWTAVDSLPVKAVAADVIIPNWASDMFMNGCYRRTLTLLLKTNTVQYHPMRDTLWNLLRIDDFASLKEKFIQERDVDSAQLHASTIPMFRLIKWQDHYFTAADGIESFLRHRAIKKLYIGTQGHSSDRVTSERVFQYTQVIDWFYYFLQNQQNGILDRPMITYAYSSLPMDSDGYFSWTREGINSWPPPRNSTDKILFAS
ncbi:MAG TPA: alpha/beta fold hydrolase [Bacteroidota bacterium]|nr:alpha/beta fold hydrolase [Bacteroidota bacterium]